MLFYLLRQNSPKCYFAFQSKIKVVLNAVLPLEQRIFTYLMLLSIKCFDVYQLGLPSYSFFKKNATRMASNPKQTHKKIRPFFITKAFNGKVDADFFLLSSVLIYAECRKENISDLISLSISSLFRYFVFMDTIEKKCFTAKLKEIE